jgi:acyl-CoA dehydrogenase
MIDPLPHEYELLKAIVKKFFSDETYQQENEHPDFCRKLIRAMGDAKLLDYVAPSPSSRNLCFLRYSIAQFSALADLLFAMQGLGSFPISVAGNEEQKRKYLPVVTRGEKIAAFAMTEPEAGSDAGAMQTRATKTEQGYVLNGIKTLISNAGLADFYTIFARTSEGSRGISAFILDASSRGLQTAQMELMGAHPIGRLELKDCFVHESQLLGTEGEGLRIAMSTLDVFRSSVGAAAIGMAERAFQEAISYSKSRKQFGKSLGEFQGVQFKIAEMAQALAASKHLVWHAASRKDSGARTNLESAIAKSFATEAAQQIIDQSLQIHGGIGLLKGSITERLYRDVRALRIYEGATEILKSIIAAHYLKEDV